ncbi:MAG: N-formylglutamate amidohydrolase [SAR324 cluster bacterium]|nr:N-formylglutamate amidohydrolase [SAR324 cluster bacterium]
MKVHPPAYKIIRPNKHRLPILLSVPHCGTLFTEDLYKQFDQKHLQYPDDTDWFVDQLYDFAPALGITMIVAQYSRYVIDLNRDPAGKPLYEDGRAITQIVPTHTFFGQPLYSRAPPTDDNIQLRRERYFHPYHLRLQEELQQLQQTFPHVLLWDAHSIRKSVPTIREDPFPDLILGNQNGYSASAELIRVAVSHLSEDKSYDFLENDPFKGGYITRHHGNPQQGVHALQLEMAKSIYMDEETSTYLPDQADKIRKILIKTLIALASQLKIHI